MHRITCRSIFITIIIIIFANFTSISSNSQFCSTLQTTTKQDECPNPSSFDILEENSKPLSSWKLNIPVLTSNNDSYIIEELTKRFNQGDSCPYIR
ncbi:unnamed protein product [Rotaria sordida]|nr:unnamed protein product [Rotaria sordida]CAF1657534.1 unnamed protein product [Rotaria sordida]